MLRFLVYAAITLGVFFLGATVKLGNRTFFGHVRAIWATEEAQDLKNGVKQKTGPAVDRVKKGVKAGIDAVESSGSGSGAGSGSGVVVR
jgi:hypothetical protein